MAEASAEAPITATLLDNTGRVMREHLADEHPRSFNPLAVTKKLTTTYRPYPVVGVSQPRELPVRDAGVGLGRPALAASAPLCY